MPERTAFLVTLLGLLVPFRPFIRDGRAGPRRTAVAAGWDYGSMPPDERYADWS